MASVKAWNNVTTLDCWVDRGKPGERSWVRDKSQTGQPLITIRWLTTSKNFRANTVNEARRLAATTGTRYRDCASAA